ncbi:hypothetical protein BD413DRAFT_637000 [Trametes elegans]|nr:hypothetical protein BD413DRAFT_637000 [Trametes elegans]
MRAAGYKLYGAKIKGSEDTPFAPFRSQLDADVAHWAKLRGPTSNAFSELVAIKGASSQCHISAFQTHAMPIQLVEKLGLSYKNANELNRIIDTQLPNSRPSFSRYEAMVMGETFEMYARPLMDCLVALYSNAEHVQYLCFTPERHYADDNQVIRLYHDLHTGKWWWSVQKQLEEVKEGATVMPVIISSDKTQVTLFRNKTAYPVYVTIGNLPKSIRQKPGRQGQILLAYLPTSRLDHISNQAQRRRILANMFHACMKTLLKPLESAGVDGVVMTSGDGVSRRCHPILAAYVGDYPEQCLVTCAYNGDCPICQTKHFNLEQFPIQYPLRDFKASLNAVKSVGTDNFARACEHVNIKPVQHPFWEDLPYVNIFQSITVDVLHQLYQGMFKHLVSWLKEACSTAEIDARVARLPPNHSIRIFYKGISNLARISGAEHRQISRFLLGVIVDMDLPGGRETTSRLVRATRALLDFIYLAQYPIHSTETLSAMDTALCTFHEHRDLFGTTDNYSTETSERLHIDFTKDAYRATNHKDEYPQMTRWLERREKIIEHRNYVLWRLQQVSVGPQPLLAHRMIRWHPPNLDAPLDIKMTHHPTRKVPLDDILSPLQYGAKFFIPALARFQVQWLHPEYSARRTEYHAEDFTVPFDRLPVFHRIKFWNEAVYGKETIDSVHVHPRSTDPDGDVVLPARFDTALVRVRNNSGAPRMDGSEPPESESHMRVVQVRVVFTLPEPVLDIMFPAVPAHQRPPPHLAYVEWFSPFTAPDPSSGMYRVSRTVKDGDRVVSIIPVSLIERSVHLIPKWPRQVPPHWSSENVLEHCSTFYVNPFKDPNTYFNVY